MRRAREVGRLGGSVAWDVMSERARAIALHVVMIMTLVEVLHKSLKISEIYFLKK
jgi:hypothetical protein